MQNDLIDRLLKSSHYYLHIF